MFLSKISMHSCMIIHYIGEENIFCCCWLHAFVTEDILKRHIKNYFKINGKQKIIMPEKGEYVQFKNFERNIKSAFMMCADFEIVLVSEDNGKQNLS